jgi:hypothetical protein
MAIFDFTATNMHGVDSVDTNNSMDASYTITEDGYISALKPEQWDEGTGYFNIGIVSQTEDYLKLCWSNPENMQSCIENGGDDEYFFFDEAKARAFMSSAPVSEGNCGEQMVGDLVSGHVTFKDSSDNTIAIPSDAWVRIIPSRYQIEGVYTGVNCKIDSSGNFGNECYIHRDESEMRDAFNDSSETFQVVVYAETTGDHYWEGDREGENSYGALGNDVSNDAWHNFEIVLND